MMMITIAIEYFRSTDDHQIIAILSHLPITLGVEGHTLGEKKHAAGDYEDF